MSPPLTKTTGKTSHNLGSQYQRHILPKIIPRSQLKKAQTGRNRLQGGITAYYNDRSGMSLLPMNWAMYVAQMKKASAAMVT